MSDPNAYSGEKPGMRETVVLPLGQNAEPGKCGSCHFFGRRNESLAGIRAEEQYHYNSGGYCKMQFPPQLERRIQGEGAPTNWINDDGSCDLWRSSGKTYIVARKITP